MIRETLDGGARHATMLVSAAHGYVFQRRPTGRGQCDTAGSPGTAPGWVRLVRTGDLFKAYHSTDGVTWTLVGSDTIAMSATVYVGLAATSHNTLTSTTAIVDAFTVVAATPDGARLHRP